MSEVKRKANAPHRIVSRWQRNLDTDRGYRARVESAITRGQYTPLGTPSNGPKEKHAAQ